MKPIVKMLNRFALHIAFLQAWTAMLASLYFSEIRHFAPCLLCWYQRILMFPLVILFTVAIIRKEKSVAFYALPMSILGMLIAAYQYLLQMTKLSQITPVSCDALGSCSAIQIMYFGFITIPLLSFVAFATISILMVAVVKSGIKK